MPQAFVALFAYIGVDSALVAIGFSAAAAVAITYAAAALATNFLLGQLSKLLSGSDHAASVATGQQFTLRDTVSAGTMAYGGPFRTSGALVFEYTSGNRNQYLWIVIAVARHQCEAMTDVWLDNVIIADSSINAGTGAVTAGQYAGKVFVYRFLGNSSQTVCADLNTALPATWDSNHRGRGVAYVVFKLEQDSTVFPTGAPQNYFVNLKGRRLYDPRLDSTNGGSGAHRLTDATTWAWSENPALVYADYCTGGSVVFDTATPVNVLGMKQAASRINWSLISNAANICDQTPAVPPSTTQKRYTFGGQLSCADSHATNVSKILSSCVGMHVNSGGKFRLYAGAYDAPTITFTDSDLIGAGYEILNAGRASLYNLVTSVYVDPGRNYQEVNSQPITDSSYVTADGEQIPKTVDLGMVQNEYRCQRICTLILKQSRNLQTIKLYLGINGFKIGLWETFNLTLIEPNFASKVFRCVEWALAPDQPGVTITAREETSAAYTDPIIAAYAAPGSATGAVNVTETAAIPDGLTASPIADAIIFTWTQASYFPPGATYRLYRYTAITPLSSATAIWEGTSAHVTVAITDSSNPTLYYWVVSVNKGIESESNPAPTTGLAAKALSVTGGFRAAASPTALYKSGSTGTLGTATCNISTTNGTPAFTYAWTRTAGDASTTISSSTSGSVTFTRTGCVIGNTYISTWQCVVTDSTAATFTVTVQVTLACKSPLT